MTTPEDPPPLCSFPSVAPDRLPAASPSSPPSPSVSKALAHLEESAAAHPSAFTPPPEPRDCFKHAAQRLDVDSITGKKIDLTKGTGAPAAYAKVATLKANKTFKKVLPILQNRLANPIQSKAFVRNLLTSLGVSMAALGLIALVTASFIPGVNIFSTVGYVVLTVVLGGTLPYLGAIIIIKGPDDPKEIGDRHKQILQDAIKHLHDDPDLFRDACRAIGVQLKDEKHPILPFNQIADERDEEENRIEDDNNPTLEKVNDWIEAKKARKIAEKMAAEKQRKADEEAARKAAEEAIEDEENRRIFADGETNVPRHEPPPALPPLIPPGIIPTSPPPMPPSAPSAPAAPIEINLTEDSRTYPPHLKAQVEEARVKNEEIMRKKDEILLNLRGITEQMNEENRQNREAGGAHAADIWPRDQINALDTFKAIKDLKMTVKYHPDTRIVETIPPNIDALKKLLKDLQACEREAFDARIHNPIRTAIANIESILNIITPPL